MTRVTAHLLYLVMRMAGAYSPQRYGSIFHTFRCGIDLRDIRTDRGIKADSKGLQLGGRGLQRAKSEDESTRTSVQRSTTFSAGLVDILYMNIQRALAHGRRARSTTLPNITTSSKQTRACAPFYITSEDAKGVAPVRKPTTFMTNSIEMKKIREWPCPGCARHVQPLSGRAAAAQVHPKALCRALCQGIVKQAQADAQSLMSLECGEVAMDVDIDNIEHEVEDWRRYWDDMSGEPLDTGPAKEARAEEIREVHRMGVYIEVSLEECIRETGKAPVGTRWVDVNKGDAKNPKVRSRLVA